MKMNTFTLGAVAGVLTLALAVPVLAQISSAATSSSAVTTGQMKKHPVPTQQQVLDMAARDTAFLKNIDAFVAVQKTVKQAHLTALTAAAAITDDVQRDAAMKKANDDERTAMQAAITANPDLKSMTGDRGQGFGGGKGGPGMMGGRGLNTADLAAKLGMTEADLKAALAGGKTIQQLATEKGVTLPAPPAKGSGMMGRGGPNIADLATKLGMTQADLQVALDSGKTIQQIATEKGVTLPPKKEGKRGGFMMNRGPSDPETSPQQ